MADEISSAHTSLVGERISNFVLLERIGLGGVGTLYRGLDEVQDDEVALRVIRPELAAEGEAARDFIAGAVAAAQLEHPGIVPIRKIGYDEPRDLYYMVSEFVPGETLAVIADRIGRLDPVDTARIGIQLLDALAVAHAEGVFHGDLHAGQLLLAPVGDVKITDFGLRRSIVSDGEATRIVGRPRSIAPELFEGRPRDARADLYAVGCALYRLACGQDAYAGTNPAQILQSVMTANYQPLDFLVEKMPPPIAEFVHRLIQREPDDRYQTAADAASELRRIVEILAPGPKWCSTCHVESDPKWTTCVRCGSELGPTVRVRLLSGGTTSAGVPASAVDDSEAPTMAESAESVTSAELPGDDLSADLGLRLCERVTFEGVSRPALGGIALLSELGRGGMGVVYFGVDMTLHRDVAVKVLPTGHRRISEQRIHAERFMREARLAAQLNSPHVVGVHAFGNDLASHLSYIVMPYVEGPTARAWARGCPGRGAPEADALAVCIATAIGLSHAHENGIVHRDVKPENVLIPRTPDGTVQLERALLADLGLGRLGDQESSLTATGQGMGTPGYMSPEQIGDASAVDHRTDVFSLGATLYSLLAGSSPFKTTGNWVMNTMSGGYPKLAQRRPDISAETCTIIAKCLRYEPTERYATAAELLEAMQSARSHLGA